MDEPTPGLDPYSLWPLYAASGLGDPLPLPYARKEPPPRGTTGRAGRPLTPEQHAATTTARRSNVAIHIARGVLGIDMDEYAKGDVVKSAWAAYDAFRDALGLDPLPFDATLWTSSRDVSTRSGIYLFRTPEGWQPAGTGPWGSTEWVWWGHRYAVVWPSVHPDTGGTYTWRHDGAVLAALPPDALDLVAPLPTPWLDALGADAAEQTRRATRPDAGGDVGSALFERWAESAGGRDQAPCSMVERRRAALMRELATAAGGSRHDTATKGTAELARLAAEGHEGAAPAVLDVLRLLRARTGRDAGEASRLVSPAGGFAPLGARPADPCAHGSADPFAEHAVTPGREWVEHQREAASPSLASSVDVGALFPADDARDDETERPTETFGGLIMTGFDAADFTPTEWLYRGTLPLGSVVTFAGQGGVGKSTLWAQWAAGVSTGTLPGEYEGVPRRVAILAYEDDKDSVLGPRLLAAGADLSMFDVLNPDRTIMLPRDVPSIVELVRAKRPGLLVIDPIAGHVGGTGEGRSNDQDLVRHAMGPLNAVCQEYDTTVLMVAHTQKVEVRPGANLAHLVAGSQAFTSAARLVLLAMRDPAGRGAPDAPLVYGVVKGNLEGVDHEARRVRADLVTLGRADGLQDGITLQTIRPRPPESLGVSLSEYVTQTIGELEGEDPTTGGRRRGVSAAEGRRRAAAARLALVMWGDVGDGESGQGVILSRPLVDEWVARPTAVNPSDERKAMLEAADRLGVVKTKAGRLLVEPGPDGVWTRCPLPPSTAIWAVPPWSDPPGTPDADLA